MPKWLTYIAGLIGSLLYLSQATTAFSSEKSGEYNHIYRKYARKYAPSRMSVSQFAALLKAVAQRESSEDPDAVNNSDNIPGTPYNERSTGLMQVLCPQALNVMGWPDGDPSNWDTDPDTVCADLTDPDYNVKIGAQILAWNIDHGGSAPHFPEKGVSLFNAYNNHNKQVTPADRFTNQGYVNDVMNNYRELLGTV